MREDQKIMVIMCFFMGFMFCVGLYFGMVIERIHPNVVDLPLLVKGAAR